MSDVITCAQHEHTLAVIGRLPKKLWTTDELVRLTEAGTLTAEDRLELIDGDIVPMSPVSRRREVIAETIEVYMRRSRYPDFTSSTSVS